MGALHDQVIIGEEDGVWVRTQGELADEHEALPPDDANADEQELDEFLPFLGGGAPDEPAEVSESDAEGIREPDEIMQDDDPMDDFDAFPSTPQGHEPPRWTRQQLPQQRPMLRRPGQFPRPIPATQRAGPALQRPVPQTRFTGAIGAIGAIGASQPFPQTRFAGASKPVQQSRLIGAAPTASFPQRVQRPIPSRPASRPP